MKWMTRKRRGRDITEPIFDNKEEYYEYWRDLGRPAPPIVEDWKTAKPGDWVLADDGGIVKILEEHKLGPSRVLRTIVGLFNASRKNVVMDTDPSQHKKWGRISSRTRLYFRPSEREKHGLNISDVKFVKLLYRDGLTVEEAYRRAYGVKTTDTRKITKRLVEKLGEKRVMSVLKDEIARACNDLGIDPVYLLTKVKDLVENARSDAVKLNALKELMEIIGMKDFEERKVTGKFSIQSPISGDEIAEIEAEARQVKMGKLEAGHMEIPEEVGG